MDHPIKTLLFELFVEPPLRFLGFAWRPTDTGTTSPEPAPKDPAAKTDGF
jgi:hypothetical protein